MSTNSHASLTKMPYNSPQPFGKTIEIMQLTALGVNHHTAPLHIRERLVILPDQMQACAREFQKTSNDFEATVLSTCNRMEIYSIGVEQQRWLEWICQTQQCAFDEIQPYLYVHHNEAAIRHLLRVATGVDSMVLGEAQILGQVKEAYRLADDAGTVGPYLQRLFQYVFSATKAIRSETGIGHHALTIAYAAVNMAKHLFAHLEKKTAIVIGAGNTGQLCLRYLQNLGIQDIWLCNRTMSKAETIALQYQTKAFPLNELNMLLPNADIIITATSAPLPLIGKGMIERALKMRKNKPYLLLDLSVPRNIEPEISEIPDAYLYCIDDLQEIINTNLKDRKLAAKQAEEMIELQVQYFMRFLNSLNAVDTIKLFRDKITQLSDSELNKALRKLDKGIAAEEVLKQFAHQLSHKILHQPTIALKEAAMQERIELLAITKELFEL